MAQLEKFKISANIWDSDKDPKGFNLWAENMGSLVRATEHGLPLELMLDSKLRRRSLLRQSVPSFLLDDPDFAPAMGAAAEAAAAEDPDPPEYDDTTSTGSVFTTGQHSVRYDDLSTQTKQLDALLYNVLRMNVRGSKAALLSSVTFPSYVQGILILDKHMGISKMDRIVRAFSSLDKLTYSGDALKFQTESLSLKRELDQCGANMTHYFMCKLMKAFDGKSKTIQYRIAADFNEKTIDASLNVYDLVQKYCSELASVGDGSQKPVHMIECHHCKGPHKKTDCPDLKKKGKIAKKKKENEGKKKTVTCCHCGEKGHIKPKCPKLHEPPAVPSPSVQMAAASGSAVNDTSTKPPTDTSRFTPQQLQQVASFGCNEATRELPDGPGNTR